jgi:hypothetical protein
MFVVNKESKESRIRRTDGGIMLPQPIDNLQPASDGTVKVVGYDKILMSRTQQLVSASLTRTRKSFLVRNMVSGKLQLCFRFSSFLGFFGFFET